MKWANNMRIPIVPFFYSTQSVDESVELKRVEDDFEKIIFDLYEFKKNYINENRLRCMIKKDYTIENYLNDALEEFKCIYKDTDLSFSLLKKVFSKEAYKIVPTVQINWKKCKSLKKDEETFRKKISRSICVCINKEEEENEETQIFLETSSI